MPIFHDARPSDLSAGSRLVGKFTNEIDIFSGTVARFHGLLDPLFAQHGRRAASKSNFWSSLWENIDAGSEGRFWQPGRGFLFEEDGRELVVGNRVV